MGPRTDTRLHPSEHLLGMALLRPFLRIFIFFHLFVLYFYLNLCCLWLSSLSLSHSLFHSINLSLFGDGVLRGNPLRRVIALWIFIDADREKGASTLNSCLDFSTDPLKNRKHLIKCISYSKCLKGLLYLCLSSEVSWYLRTAQTMYRDIMW